MNMKSPTPWMWLAGLAALGLPLAAGWERYASSLALLRDLETASRWEAAKLDARIEKAQATIAEIQAKETAASRLRSELKRKEYAQPVGSAALWMPTLVKENFARSGIAVRLVRLNAMHDEPAISGYERGIWSVILPVEEARQNETKLRLAVAEIESQNPFMRVLDFAIRPDPENPSGRVVSLNFAALVRK